MSEVLAYKCSNSAIIGKDYMYKNHIAILQMPLLEAWKSFLWLPEQSFVSKAPTNVIWQLTLPHQLVTHLMIWKLEDIL